MAVRLNLLGGFGAVAAAGPALAFPTAKSKALLAYLALNDDRAHSRDKLAALLWGAHLDGHARASLRQALSRVRGAWPKGIACCLRADNGTVAIDPAAVTLDVAAYERLAVEGTPEALERAAALYRGELLDGLVIAEDGFEDWLRAERARLAEIARGVLQGLLDHYANTGAIDRGIRTALRLLALDPLLESVHRTLIRFYLEQGGAHRGPNTAALAEDIPGAAASRVARVIPAKPSIVVRPFASLGGAAAEPYLSDGIAEDVITELTRFRDLHVIARNSAFAFRDGDFSAQQVGRALGVQYVLEGSIRRLAGRIRITVQLIEAATGHQVWAERYDAPMDGLAAMQDNLIRRIVSTLVGRIGEDRLARAVRKPPEDWRAHDHWLQGMACLRTVNTETSIEARAAFEKAIAIDPGYARAYAGLAMAQFQQWSCLNWSAWSKLSEKAFGYARKAVALDDADHHAHCILGTVYTCLREYDSARKHFDRTLALNPNDANILANASMSLAPLGDRDAAAEAVEAAIRLDPYHPDWYLAVLGLVHFVGRDHARAIQVMEAAPDGMCDTRAYLAAACAHAGRDADAKRHAAEFLRACGDRLGGTPASDTKRYLAWLHDTSPFRKPADTAHFTEGLGKAGLMA